MQGNLNDLMKDIPPQIARNVARFGVKLAIDLLQTLYADLEQAEPEAQPKKRGRKAKAKPERNEEAAAYGWPATAEERSAEMRRRQAVAKEKVRKAKLGAAAKRRWNSMTEAQKATRLRAMQRGKQHKEAA